jgi:hypothetical protein
MLLKNTACEQRGVPADAPAQLDTFASAPKAVIEPISIHLVAYDTQDADRLGMAALGPEGRRAALRGAFPRLTAKELGEV